MAYLGNELKILVYSTDHHDPAMKSATWDLTIGGSFLHYKGPGFEPGFLGHADIIAWNCTKCSIWI